MSNVIKVDFGEKSGIADNIIIDTVLIDDISVTFVESNNGILTLLEQDGETIYLTTSNIKHLQSALKRYLYDR